MSETIDRHDDLPPLRIVHFMLWTAVVAFGLGVARIDVFATYDTAGYGVLHFVSGIVVGSTLVTVILLRSLWRSRGIRLPLDCGDFVAVIGAAYATQFVIYSLHFVLIEEQSSYSSWFDAGLYLLDRAAPWVFLVAYLIAAIKCRRPARWRAFFVAGSLVATAYIVGEILRVAVNYWFRYDQATNFWVGYVTIVVTHLTLPVGLGTLLFFVSLRDLTSLKQHHWTRTVAVIAASILIAAQFNTELGLLSLFKILSAIT